MLKRGEKIIFSIKSGFSLNGLKDYDLEDKCLHFTDLGNIYISKVDCLKEECIDYIMYDYTAHNITLYSEIDGESINVVSENLPITVCQNGIEKNSEANLIIILDFEEFATIDNQIKEMIFDFKHGDMLMVVDGRYTYKGEITVYSEKIVFNAGDMRFEYDFSDVEFFDEEYNRIRLNGYFYLDMNSSIVRKVSFSGNLSDYKLPIGFELKVERNKKIGFVPWNDKMVVANITGRIASKTYLNEPIYIIKHDEMYIFYEKKAKKEIFSKRIEKFSKYEISCGRYIIYDSEYVYTIDIDKKSYESIGLGKLGLITYKYIGYSDKKNPFFIKIDDEHIKICDSNRESVLDIKKTSISEITVHEELNLENGDLVNTEIRFGNKKVFLNLKRSLITDITENVFSDYQISLFENASIREVYENWVKTVSDMVIYNIFGELYRINGKFVKPETSSYNLVDWIRFVNRYYITIEKRKKEIDNITVYMADILEKNEEMYFKGLGIDADITGLERLDSNFLETRYALINDFNEVLRKFDKISNVIMPEKFIEEYIDNLNEHEIYQIEYFAKQGMDSLNHMLYDMLPHYIEKVIKSVFTAYFSIYDEYIKIDEKELKFELMNRIKSAHVFKQFTIDSDSSILRKDIVDDLYSLVKFSAMKIDSEFYYTGGYR